MITIIDYGIGNLGSVQNMLKKVGIENHVTGDPTLIDQATKILFPGVGAFSAAMTRLKERGIIELLTKKVKQDKVPVLGICLGMQLMTNSSEEGGLVKGLSWIDAETIRFQFPDTKIKVPHKGWNFVSVSKKNDLFSEAEGEQKFYFDHSYFVRLANQEEELLSTHYGIDFTSSFCRENIYGVQFHPEKSHRYGMSLLKHFAEI